MPRDVLFLIYPGVQPIDLAGPFQAFSTAEEEVGGGAYRVRVAAERPGPVVLAGGMPVIASPLPRSAPDTLVIPGGPGVHSAREQEGTLRALRRYAARARRVCSVCTGAFLLAQTGLLHQRRAVTHWRSCERLSREFPDIAVDPDPIWIRQGRIWTSAGVTAGIDLALALIEEDLGAPLAARVARRLVVYVRRSAGQAQYSTPLAVQAGSAFAPLLEWVRENLHAPMSTEALADRAGLAPRTFHRRFLEATGATPAKMVERLRLHQARMLMETTRLSLLEIASRTGFGTEERLRRAFSRAHGAVPAQWRRRFGNGPGQDSARA